MVLSHVQDSHDRATLEETDMDPEMREQILVCDVAGMSTG